MAPSITYIKRGGMLFIARAFVYMKYAMTTTSISFILATDAAGIALAQSVHKAMQLVRGISFIAKKPSSKPKI